MGSSSSRPDSGNHWPRNFGPEISYASVYSSVNREGSDSFYLGGGLFLFI